MKDKTLLITGGCGFIGSHLVENLTPKFKHVYVIDNLATGFLNNITPFLQNYQNLTFIHGDLTNLEFCRNFFSKHQIDLITHQAAIGSVPRSVEDPLFSHQNNVNAFLNILICMKDYNVKRIVYASSSSVYGDDPNLPKEESKIGNVLSPYACTKKIDELYADVFAKCYHIETIGLRYFNIFGARQNPEGPYSAVIPKFIKLMKEGKCPQINGDGSFSRDFTHVLNAVQANELALTTRNPKALNTVYNIGAGGNTTIKKLFQILKKELDFKEDPIYGNYRKGDIPHSHANISKAQELLGYQPKITFEEGIKRLTCEF